MKWTTLAVFLLFSPFILSRVAADTVSSELHDFRVVPVVQGLANPWGFVFLPDGGMLITERPGRLQFWKDGELRQVGNAPAVVASGQGGMLDVAIHPEFEENRWVYLTHSSSYDGGVGTTVTRGRLNFDDVSLEEVEMIYRIPSPGGGGQHFGSRMAFDDEGYLFVTVGDRGQQARAQQLNRAEGSLLRFYDDGSVPEDNPFVGQTGALPEIWSYGHRNPQGLYFDPVEKILWQHEHGPQGGDTLNRIQPGLNYGWPVATYGDTYGSGNPIGDLPHEREDIENPYAYWVPTSIAPSGLVRYYGHVFPRWRGNLFLGTLAQQHIRRLEPGEDGLLHEEEMLRGAIGRIRDVRVGPDDLLYFLTDANPGGLFRLEPAKTSPWFEMPIRHGWRDSAAMGEEFNIGRIHDAWWPWIAIESPMTNGWHWVAEEVSTSEQVVAWRANENEGEWLVIFAGTGWYYRISDETWQSGG